MIWVVAIALMFGLGAVLGAPWLPTRRREIAMALGLLDLAPGQTVIDLGCGSGGFCRAAARQGLQVAGYEINPLLWLIAWLRLWRYPNATVHFGNYWSMRLPACDGVYVFLIERYMGKLDRKLTAELGPGTPVVSYVFTIPDKTPAVSRDGLHLYRY